MTPDKRVGEKMKEWEKKFAHGLSGFLFADMRAWTYETLTQYHQDITNKAMAREKQLKQIHTMELDTISCMSIEQFVVWCDQRKQRPTIIKLSK